MAQTALITGCSSGMGKATALAFLDAGWNVIATMRDIRRWEGNADGAKLLVAALDVADDTSIHAAVAQGVARFGRIDCAINNAGQGLFSVFEATPLDTMRSVFDTNFFGALRVLQALLPHFDQHGGGRIINVTSGSTVSAEPLMSAYTASKSALDAFTEAVRYELLVRRVVLKLVVPGFVPGTQFVNQTQAAAQGVAIPAAYQTYVNQRMATYLEAPPAGLASAEDVAEAVVSAAMDSTDKLRFFVGSDVREQAVNRFETSEPEYNAWVMSKFSPR